MAMCILDEISSACESINHDANKRASVSSNLSKSLHTHPKKSLIAVTNFEGVTMAEAVLSFSLDQLAIFLREEIALLGRVGDEVQHIKDELGQMKGFLRLAEAIAENNPDLEEWISQVRDVAYDAEDILDEFTLRSGRQHGDGFLGQVRKVYGLPKSLRARHQIATRLSAIKGRIRNISDAHQRYQNQYGIAQNKKWYDNRGDALFAEEADLVSIERPKKKLMDMLCTSDSQPHVISVIGMGGLGKTTLVKKLYDEVAVKNRFTCHAWITVSQSFKIKTLLRSAIQQLLKEREQLARDELDAMDINSLKQRIRDLLHQKSYIIVFDDVWSTTDWDAFRMAFPRNNCSSRIIITTRIEEVGQSAGGLVYHLEPLTKEESWTLFCKKAFRATSCPRHLEEISGSIIERCAGLPLAIAVIGGVLATKSRRTEEWDLFNKSLGEQLVDNNQLENMTKLLTLSYYELPNHLRICFLYLSILPEDEPIEKNKLIRLWIAEGFVQKKEGMTVEDVAESYVNQLVNRSLIQVAKTTIDGRIKACRIHDIIQQVILRKAREQQIAIIFSEQRSQIPDKVRRLGIHNSIDSTRVSNGLFKCLRSLVLFESIGSMSEAFLSKLLSSGLRLLKVLDLEGAPLEAILHEIFELFHLKYLSLRGTRVEIVPKSVGKLEKLETLDLRYTNVSELPAKILKLQQLRHLLVGDKFSGFKAPYKIGKLQNLQSLHNIDAGQLGDVKIVREIGKLTQLRKLGITNLRREDGMELCSSLEKLTNLRFLRVNSPGSEEFIDLHYPLSSNPQFLRKLLLDGRMQNAPEWIQSLRELTTLDLLGSRLKDDPLQLFQDLPNLLHLSLGEAYEGEGLCFKAGGFQRLRILRMWRLQGLRWVRVENGAMPFLERLSISNCESMEELPVGIQHLRSLQSLDLVGMPDRLINKLEGMDKRSAHYNNITHIHRVVIANRMGGKVKLHDLSK